MQPHNSQIVCFKHANSKTIDMRSTQNSRLSNLMLSVFKKNVCRFVTDSLCHQMKRGSYKNRNFKPELKLEIFNDLMMSKEQIF